MPEGTLPSAPPAQQCAIMLGALGAQAQGFNGGLLWLKAMALGGDGEGLQSGGRVEFLHHMALGAHQHVAGVAVQRVGAAHVGIQAVNVVHQAHLLQKLQRPIGDGGLFILHLCDNFAGGERFVALPNDAEHFFALGSKTHFGFGAALFGHLQGLVLAAVVLAGGHGVYLCADLSGLTIRLLKFNAKP